MGYEPICSLDEPIDNKNVPTHTINSSEVVDVEENDVFVWIAR